MQTHIQKWGNSLGLRIPSKISQHFNLHRGSSVDIFIEKDQIILKPKKDSLFDLVQRITKENCHYELFKDGPQGKEEW